MTSWWFQVSTHLNIISQIGSFPQVGMEIKNFWNHHLDDYDIKWSGSNLPNMESSWITIQLMVFLVLWGAGGWGFQSGSPQSNNLFHKGSLSVSESKTARPKPPINHYLIHPEKICSKTDDLVVQTAL